MAAVARLRPRINVDGFVPLSENLPSGAAQKPGDVIRYRNGKTVEVLNTDAEGRLVLADALTLAAALQPDAIIDVATLTGACMVALGLDVAGVFSNDQRLADELIAIGRAQGEQLWQLPLVPEYRDDLKSAVADLKNIGGGNAGSITGALFLQEFVDGRPWAHLDIAGPAYADKDKPYHPRGGTGFAVRTLVEYVLRSAARAGEPAPAVGETTGVVPRPARRRPTIEASQAASRGGRASPAAAEPRNERPVRPSGRRVPTRGRNEDRAGERGRPGASDTSPPRRNR
jgi:leucyl aminopeptidase